jgi:alcohol dehydrogenase
MKAAQISDYGPADHITIVDIDAPALTPGQVLIEVHAGSINPFDIKIREGYVSGMISRLPVTLGGDIAGVVRQAAPEITDVAVGDRVYGQALVVSGGSGAFAEFAATKASLVAKMPKNIDFPEAAALPLAGVSALQAIQNHLKLQPAQKILIHGGAGGIGTIAIQLAKHIGAYVATTATGEGVEYVKNLGADEVIDYKTQQFDDLLHDYDAVFDTVAGDTYERSFKVLKGGGIIVSMLEQPNPELMERYGVTAIAQQTRMNSGDLTKLASLVEDGVITPHVDTTYPLDKVADAFQAYESGTVRGKVVITVQ